MPTINSIIKESNITKLNKEKNKEIAKCNCRDKVTCPLKGKCVVNQVEVFRDPCNDRYKKVYLWPTQREFKFR